VTFTSGYSLLNSSAYFSKVPSSTRSVRQVTTLMSPFTSPSIVLSASAAPPPAQPLTATAAVASRAMPAKAFFAM
jgi:hypothetical protein